MKVLVLLAKGFEAMEASAFTDVLGWAKTDYGCDVSVCTAGLTETVCGSFGVKAVADKLLDDIDANEYDALAIPGGFEVFGFYEDVFDERVSALIKSFHTAKKPIASICVGALALANAGILTGKRATTYHLQGGLRQKQLAQYGVTVVNEPIVVTENIITSYCPQTAPLVAFELLGMLAGKEIMNTVKNAMGY